MARILVAAEDADCRSTLRELFERSGHTVGEVSESRKVVSDACSMPYDLLVLDLHLPRNSRRAIKTILEECPEICILVLVRTDSVDAAVDAMKLGATDYALLPVNVDDIRIRSERVLDQCRLVSHNEHLLSELSHCYQISDHVGTCAVVKEAHDSGIRMIQTGASVLICGESGAGKEHLARTIHHHGLNGKGAPFVRVNRPVLPEDQLDMLVFGYEDKNSVKLGRLDLANGGTVFINEIASLSLTVQAKLLAALKQKHFGRIGGAEMVRSDFRVIATTGRDLTEAVEDGSFDKELHAFFSKSTIVLPPLRDRIEDIPALADIFIRKYAGETSKPVAAISDAAISLMLDYHWQGNIRELENCIERCVIVCDGECIQLSHLAMAMGKSLTSRKLQVQMKSLREVERDHIKKVLTQCNWNRSTAASVLDIDRKTLRSKIREFGFTPPEEK